MKNSGKPRSDWPTVVLHWMVAITLILSLATGLRIATDMPDANWAHAVSGLLPQGDVISWHLWAALAMLSFIITYVGFLWRAGLTARVTLLPGWRKELAQGPSASRWKVINKLVYWLAFIAVIFAGATGLALYLMPGWMPTAVLSLLHQIAAWSLIFYIALHVLALFAVGGIWQLLKILRPRPAYGVAIGTASIAGVATAAAFLGLENTAVPSLQVTRINELPTLDGKANDAVWQKLRPVAIPTAKGVNLPGGDVTVSVRAGHDGIYFYSLFQWPDSTRSQKHLPLVKTERGWKVTQTEYGIQDEDSYYEDKFGVMLAKGSGIAGDGTIHLGNRPLDGKPGPSGGRGLHYTTDGSIVDVWHWKSVRTGNAIMGQIDDNYFGPPMKPKTSGRYTGGYTKDPKEGGGYKMNWEKYSDDIVVPRRLPHDPELLAPFQSVDLSPDASDDVALFMAMEDTVPYDEALDSYPVGTIMPAILIDAPFRGDRGDVTAATRWENGLWTMEVKRRLDTGSAYDVAFEQDQDVYLWVAVFDHAQTRHSRHLHPVRVEVR